MHRLVVRVLIRSQSLSAYSALARAQNVGGASAARAASHAAIVGGAR